MGPKLPNLRNHNDSYWQNNFNTKLSPDMESKFKAVYPDPRDTQDYDLRGAWQNGVASGKLGEHMPDTYKKPNHPTFSDESIYNGTPSPTGGTWQGGKWDENSYTPSQSMLQTTHDPASLQQYMKQYEPGVQLNLPK